MNFRSFFFLLMAVGIHGLSHGQQSKDNHNTLTASRLKPYGRYVLNEKKQLEMISSAVHFGAGFQGEKFTLFASLPDVKDHNYLQYELDGKYQGRIRIDGNAQEPVSINVSGLGTHTIWIYKATEAHTGPIIITKVVADQVKALTQAKAPLIEFIGNSITCGAAADPSDVPCGSGVYHDQHNAYMAYGPRVARMLGANFVLSSVSGIGVYRTWNQDGPSMPQVYENADFQAKSMLKWDFKTYIPEVVSIALGTNDLSPGDGKTPRKPFSQDEFVAHFVSFVKLVKTKYPKARIALLSSPMERDSLGRMLENGLTQIKKQIDLAYPSDKPVATFFFEPMDARGCGGHPSVEDHLILAQQLTPFYTGLLKENN
jgi:lysophospholipase L1-like esterase